MNKRMTVDQIMAAVEGVEALDDGEALYYLPQEDSVVLLRGAVQPYPSDCLRVGPDHISNIDIADVRYWLTQCLEYWDMR